MKGRAKLKKHSSALRVFFVRRKKWLLFGVLALVAILIGIQLVYPSSRLLPGTQIDGLSFGHWKKEDAAKALDERYARSRVGLYFGEASKATYMIAPAAIGMKVDNGVRLEQAAYPWYMRLIPSSMWWYASFYSLGEVKATVQDAKINEFIDKQIGESCSVAPVNASVAAKDGKFVVVPAADGGNCELSDVKSALQKTQPTIQEVAVVRVPVQKVAPTITDDEAKKLTEKLNERVGSVAITAGNEAIAVPAKEVVTWFVFISEGEAIEMQLSAEQARDYLDKQVGAKVAVVPGVTKVSTYDFVETSRVNGAPGRALDIEATGDAVRQFLLGESGEVVAATRQLEPRVEYSRSYSATDTGLSALLKNFTDDHPGTFGVQLVELSGQRRRAGVNETKQFTAASTYKLFVAYGTLKKVEAGQWSWSDTIAGGRNLATCFDDMIVKSDNPCAEALLEKFGYNNLNKELRAIGLSSSSGFIGNGPKATAADLATFMAALESGQLPISAEHRTKFLGALKRNVYRQGIPAGASGAVADKVGFLDGLLHDAAIVYSPSGTYVLTIMTDGSSWATIAELTREIEKIRS